MAIEQVYNRFLNSMLWNDSTRPSVDETKLIKFYQSLDRNCLDASYDPEGIVRKERFLKQHFRFELILRHELRWAATTQLLLVVSWVSLCYMSENRLDPSTMNKIIMVRDRLMPLEIVRLLVTNLPYFRSWVGGWVAVRLFTLTLLVGLVSKVALFDRIAPAVFRMLDVSLFYQYLFYAMVPMVAVLVIGYMVFDSSFDYARIFAPPLPTSSERLFGDEYVNEQADMPMSSDTEDTSSTETEDDFSDDNDGEVNE